MGLFSGVCSDGFSHQQQSQFLPDIAAALSPCLLGFVVMALAISILSPFFSNTLLQVIQITLGSPEFMVGALRAPTINSMFRLFDL